MRKILPLLGGIIAILGMASFAVGQEAKTATPDTMKHLAKKQKPTPQALAELEKAKAERIAAMQSELQNILKRVNQLPDSLRNEALIEEIQNMQSLREFKAAQYEKRLMDSTTAQSQQDSTVLRQNRSQTPLEKTKLPEDPKDARKPKEQF